mgnify:CR=1 FL=1
MDFDKLLQVDLLAITSGRLWSIISGLAGLISIIIGRMVLVRSRTGEGRNLCFVSLALGLLCVISSGIHLLLTTGGFGTGSGRAGAIVAMVVGLTGTLLSVMALGRLNRVSKESGKL